MKITLLFVIFVDWLGMDLITTAVGVWTVRKNLLHPPCHAFDSQKGIVVEVPLVHPCAGQEAVSGLSQLNIQDPKGKQVIQSPDS